MASLWLQVPEASVRSFFHDPAGNFNTFFFEFLIILIFVFVYRIT